MKDREEYLEALKAFDALATDEKNSADEEEIKESCASNDEDCDKDAERRKLTYKIEDNVAEMMTYSSIIEKSKKSFKASKKDYSKAKKEYDEKSFSALVFDILTFLGIVLSVYFLIKWLGNKSSSTFEILTYISFIFTAFVFLIALYKNLKLRPYKKKMKGAKELMHNSKIWIDESERGIKNVEDENRSLKRQRRMYK